jgi:hypothetical protein
MSRKAWRGPIYRSFIVKMADLASLLAPSRTPLYRLVARHLALGLYRYR